VRYHGRHCKSLGRINVNTPICDFVRRYAAQNPLRLHMPGHKGKALLGMEDMDITEIEGADSLYEAAGIIRESEKNASKLFGCKTFYSTEGSSQCIRAMLHLAAMHMRRQGKKPLVAAFRNVHKSFLSAAALCDVDVMWLYPDADSGYLSCDISAGSLERQLCAAEEVPAAVYLTSPDYLGKMADIAGIAKVCHKYGALLLVDCAHGAYLRFLPESEHPIDLGADICCASAHKTLPVLTGGAYLHFSPSLPEYFIAHAKNALALFGSTSPSYLILQSLDAANAYLEKHWERLGGFVPMVDALKGRLIEQGFKLYGDEKIKISLCCKKYGYKGTELQSILRGKGIFCEFADNDYLVLMLSPELGKDGLERLKKALLSIPRREAVEEKAPHIHAGKKQLSIRAALMAPLETIAVEKAEGRILASASIGCPPAVPILVCGELIDAEAVQNFKYYGIDECSVVI